MTCKGHVTARVSTFKIHITFFGLEFSNTDGLQRFRTVQHMLHYTCVIIGFSERCYYPDCSHLYMRDILSSAMSDLFSSVHEKCYTFFKVPTRLQMATPKHKEFTSSINEVKQ
jgi:hypothetical protein